MNNKFLLCIGVAMLCFGLFKDRIPSIDVLSFMDNPSVNNVYITEDPQDDNLLFNANAIVDILDNNESPTKKEECLKLSALYRDLSVLISLDDSPITDTATIREANSLCGQMLNLDIKDKYPGLAEAAKLLLVDSIGEDDVSLTAENRQKAVAAFEALSWSFYKGR